jgi:hypothetical protein
MNFGSALIGVIIIAIIAIPFVFDYRSRKNKTKALLQSIKNLASQHNGNITQYEICSDFVIGLDANSKFVFFLKQKKNEAVTQIIDLSEVKSCAVDKKVRTLNNDNGNFSLTDKVELSFTPKNPEAGITKFELYDDKANMQISGEIQLANTWSKQINDLIK